MVKNNPKGRKPYSQERLVGTYDRRPGRTRPGRCILIICEGTQTEPKYFFALKNYFKISLVDIQIEKCPSSPIKLVETAEALVKKRIVEGKQNPSILPYEEIWCVFDVEKTDKNLSFVDAIQKAKANRYSLAISNPAFEYWYVLHFESTTRPFKDGNELKNYLKNKHIPSYYEAMPVFNLIKNETLNAIQRSVKILSNHPDQDSEFPNPSTHVHVLVDEIIEMSPSARKHLDNFN